MTALLEEVTLFFEGYSLDSPVGPNDFETVVMLACCLYSRRPYRETDAVQLSRGPVGEALAPGQHHVCGETTLWTDRAPQLLNTTRRGPC